MYNYFPEVTLMKKILSVLLSVALLLCCVPMSFAGTAQSGDLLLATLSDIHYYPASLALYKSEAFYTYLKGANAIYEDMAGITDAALAALANDAKDKGLRYVVICGDLTTNGEYAGHTELAEKLAKFEEDTGLEVFVINGNHDINNTLASEFITPDLQKAPSKATTPAEFYEIYRDLGYGDADFTFADDIAEATAKQLPGALSYAKSVDGGYRLIFIDAGKYSAGNTKSGENEHETAGNITDELLDWVLAQAKDAQDKGETPIAFTHWNLSEMNYMHGEVLQGFTIDNAYKLQETFADAGIHFVFSGHQHVSDVDVTYSDAGEPLFSCIVPTLTQYPFLFRETAFTRDANGTVSAEYKQYPCDRDVKVKSVTGEEYDQPYYLTTGCAKQMGDTMDASVYLLNMIKNLLSGYISDIQEQGSIVAFIKEQFGFDLEAWLRGYIPEDIVLGGDTVFEFTNIMDFIGDLDEQLCDKFINAPDELLWPTIKTALDNIVAVQISDVPCTKFIDSYGFGDAEKGGTIGDLFFSAMVYMYPGNEDISDDLFIQDVLAHCGEPEFVDIIFDTVIEYVVNDVALDTILGEAEIHLDTLISGGDDEVRDYVRLFFKIVFAAANSEIYKSSSIDDFMAKLQKMADLLGSGQSLSYRVLIETVLGTGLIDYGSTTNDVIYKLLDTYLGDAQKKAAAYQLYVIASDLFIDEDKDWDVTYTYAGPVEVEPTVEDMQLPANVNMSLGKDASTSVNVRWMTKYSVTGSDIELVKANDNFTGKPTTAGIEAKTECSVVSGYGFDFGTFGILPWTREVNIHTLAITGLEPGTGYKFRIGDFEKGFVSEGSFTTAGSDEKFSFAFLSDAAGVTPAMYENFDLAVKTAADGNDLSFIIDGGNSVCKGDNEDQWSWALNGARDTFLNVPVQYVSGKGDIGDTMPVTKHFAITDIPDYAESVYGVFYSYDYENAHFTVLNTNELDTDGTLTAGQLKWLDKDLTGTQATWKILVLHTPLYGVNTVNEALRLQLLNLINTHSVNLVLGGTDSVYSRTHVIDEGTALPNNDVIITTVNGKRYEAYINVPGFISLTGCFAGSEYADELPEGKEFKKTVKAEAPVYTVFTVEGDTLAADTFKVNADGSVEKIDSFAVTTQYTHAMMGDIDFNEKITAADARLALRAAVGLESLSSAQKLAADVDFDKKISASDARSILRAAVELEKLDPQYFNYKPTELSKLGF